MFRSVHHPGMVGITWKGDDSIYLSLNSGHPMERIASLLKLHILWFRFQTSHPIPDSFEDRFNGLKILISRLSDVRNEFKQNSPFRFLDKNTDGELVPVKIPGEIMLFLHNRVRMSCDRISKTKQLFKSKKPS